MKDYYIYVHKDKNTGEVLYVGKGSTYKGGGERAEDFRKRKYDRESVEVIILPMRYKEETLAYEIEELIIGHYKSLGICKYNIYIGHRPPNDFIEERYVGENNPMYGKHHTSSARENMSKTKKERNVMVGENNHMYGKHHNEETKKKMRNNKKTHIVYCYETNKYYKGTGEASEQLGMNRGAISNCCTRGTMGFSKKLNIKVRLEYRDEE